MEDRNIKMVDRFGCLETGVSRSVPFSDSSAGGSSVSVLSPLSSGGESSGEVAVGFNPHACFVLHWNAWVPFHE